MEEIKIKQDGEVKVPFQEMFFKETSIHAANLFSDHCAECGYKFQPGDVYYVYRDSRKHVKAYLCKECYDAKYIDV